ncbi:MAG: hypothetical protein WAM91_00565 [Candidatus Acidiferrales bacterium]
MLSFLLFLAALLPQQSLHVDVRSSEVWLTRNGVDIQLTHDGKAKLQAELSPKNDRIAYYEEFPESEGSAPSVVILDLDGRRINSFHVNSQQTSDPSPCMSILSIAWLNDSELAAECHINPSLSELIVSDLRTGRITRDLFGFSFAPSPDGKMIAHAGWVPHFSPAYERSEYLQIDDTLIYPLAAGKNPVALKLLEVPPDAVRNEDLSYFGIHELASGFYWSPDSRHIAFVDCTYDWKARDAERQAGDESNRACSLIAVSRDGKFQAFPLSEISPGDLYQAKISWNSPHEIAIASGATKKTFQAP